MASENTVLAENFRFIYTVSHLNNEVRDLLEGTFPLIWVEGEVSNFTSPSSGHWYFTLKDEGAQVRAAMFRARNTLVGFRPANGSKVLARVRVSLYAPRGDYQLIVEHMEEAGDGALRRAFDALKQRLATQGLFDAAHKRPLPEHPRRIGVITSPTGAAIRDILTVLRRRFPAMEVIVYPVAVQGSAAAAEIAAMIAQADARAECDVLIVGRGGGSLEDLWAFNEEPVAQAIYRCQLPVISAVGHEIDFTIADFVADVRAPTPSAAAELVSPDQSEWLRRLAQLEARLSYLVRNRLARDAQQISWLARRLQSPQQRLRSRAQRLDELEIRLQRSQQLGLVHARQRLGHMRARLERHTPTLRLVHAQQRLSALRSRQSLLMRHALQDQRQGLAALARALDAVSPLATLHRGYAIVERLPGHQVLLDAKDVSAGDHVQARLAKGRLRCVVEEVVNE